VARSCPNCAGERHIPARSRLARLIYVVRRGAETSYYCQACNLDRVRHRRNYHSSLCDSLRMYMTRMNSKFCDTASIATIYPSIGTGAPLRIVHLGGFPQRPQLLHLCKHTIFAGCTSRRGITWKYLPVHPLSLLPILMVSLMYK